MFEVGGFVFFFRALHRGDLAVVAPIIGLEGGMAALIVFAFGERVSPLVGVGLAVALCGGCLAAAAGGRRTAAGALPAFGAALCLGAMFALYAAAEDLGPVTRRRQRAPERAGAPLRHRAVARRAPAGRAAHSRRLLALGALDAAAFVSYAYRRRTRAGQRRRRRGGAVLDAQRASLGIVLLHERLRPHQYVGIALAGIGTTLLALAQS